MDMHVVHGEIRRRELSLQWMSVIFLAAILPIMAVSGDECRNVTKVDMSKHCGKQYLVHSAMALFPATHEYSFFPAGLNCTVTLGTASNQQLAATVYDINTETGVNGTCTKNRLDIYDGEKETEDHLLSNKTGLCGCDVPDQVYKSTNNSLTITFTTERNGKTQHGTFDLVISAITKDVYNETGCPGQFECAKSGKCIDKNEVCDGKSNCADHSDETGCKKPPVPSTPRPHPTPKPHHKCPPIWMWILIGLAALCAILFTIIIIVLLCRYCSNPYTRIP